MDRKKRDELPKMQVGFIDFICMPLYKVLAELLPGLNPLFHGVQCNRQNWQALHDNPNGKDFKIRIPFSVHVIELVSVPYILGKIARG